MKNRNGIITSIVIVFLMIAVFAISWTYVNSNKIYNGPYYTIDTVPDYKYDSYVVINNNIPEFDENSITQARL